MEPKKAGKLILKIFLIVFAVLILILILALLFINIYKPSLKEGYAFSSTGKILQLPDGRDLAYIDSGDPDGFPLFYFHGSPGSRFEGLLFEDLNRELGIRMISTDRPGFGLSDFQEKRTYLNWVEDISVLADYLDIDKFAVLGWSSGGPYAAAISFALPKRVTAAAIVAGEGPYADMPKDIAEYDNFKFFTWSGRHAPWMLGAMFKVMRMILFARPEALSDLMGNNVPPNDVRFFTVDFRNEYIAILLEAFRTGTKGVVQDMVIERREWPFRLNEIKDVPVSVFIGEDDHAVHSKVSEYVCSQISSSEDLIIFSGQGHSVVYYRYREIIGTIFSVDEY